MSADLLGHQLGRSVEALGGGRSGVHVMVKPVWEMHAYNAQGLGDLRAGDARITTSLVGVPR